jgi:hypothetical protein
MNHYEIRLVPKRGSSLFYAFANDSDLEAVAYAKNLAGDEAAVEVWRGMDCLYRRTASLRGRPQAESLILEEIRSDLKYAVESRYGGRATFVQAVPVHEEHGGHTLWDGIVAIFDLKGCPTGAFRAYAWNHELPNGRRRLFSVLHAPHIVGPQHAVRAAIMAE